MMARRVMASSKRLWTPREITTALWLDAADSATITKDGSNLISQWNDKSGNSRHATQSGTSRPTYTAAGQNGRSVATFENKWMILPESIAPSAAWSIFSVYNSASTTASKTLIAKAYNWGSFYVVVRANNDASNPRKLIAQTGVNWVSEVRTPSASNADNGAAIASAIYDKANISSAINGEAFSSLAYTPSPTYNADDRAALGAFRNFSNTVAGTMNGWIAEIIVFHTAVSATTRQIIEGYLAHKWGLTANLPAAHPYKFATPRV